MADMSIQIGTRLLEDHTITCPLTEDPADGRTIDVFARVITPRGGGDLPFLVFLQGGPGNESPALFPSWMTTALARHRVVLLDPRGDQARVDRRGEGDVDGAGEDDLLHGTVSDRLDGGGDAGAVLVGLGVGAHEACVKFRAFTFEVVRVRVEHAGLADDALRDGERGRGVGQEGQGADDHLRLAGAQGRRCGGDLGEGARGTLGAHGAVAAGEQEVRGGGRTGSGHGPRV